MKRTQEISNRVMFELRITVGFGVANNRVTAKLVSCYLKPDAITRIEAYNHKEIAYPQSVDDLLQVKPATSRKLSTMGICMIGRLAECPVHVLVW